MKRFQEFYQLNPVDSEISVRSIYQARLQKLLPGGDPVTEEFLISKYQEYLEILQERQAGRYTKKEDKIMGPFTWLNDELYMIPLKRSPSPNDFYLYGI